MSKRRGFATSTGARAKAPAAAALSRMATGLTTPHARPPEGQEDGEGFEERPWTEVVGRRGAELVEKKSLAEIEMREGDWRCMVEECRGEINFRRRRECWKCGADKAGNRRQAGTVRTPVDQDQGRWGQSPGLRNSGDGRGRLGLSPTDRLRRRVEEERGPMRRQSRLIILTINVSVGGKTQVRPVAGEHYDIIRQAGLDIEEVRGVVAKPGYLEVAMVPGAVSVVGALRESTKQVNSKMMITSVRERGTNRVVVVKWQEVPFEVKDETLVQYTDLFATSEKLGMRLWWETVRAEDDPEGKMVGKWTGERSLPVRLKPDIGHIPTWHYVGGARLKIHVQGRKNCSRCLKSVGECKGGGDWRKCEASKVARGDWKVEQETFLESLGWGEKKQRIMEGLEDQLPSLVGEEEEERAKAMEDQAERDAEAREGLVEQLEPGKECGGVLLRNFPERVEGQITEKKDLLMMVMVMSNLRGEEEENRLQQAQVEVNRTEREGRKVLDLKISLEGADLLLRKVWRQLQKLCKQERVRRYQIEARTVVTPVRARPPTELEKAREIVEQLIEEEKATRKNELRKVEEEKRKREMQQQEKQALEKLMQAGKNQPLNPAGQTPLALTYVEEVQELNKKVVTERRVDPHQKESSEDEDEEGGETVFRVRKPRWTPPEGWRRCGQGCEGCSAKCVEQEVEECHNCYLNRVNGGSSNSCYNRGDCVDLKEQKPQERKTRTKSKIPGNRDSASLSVSRVSEKASKSPATTTKVGSQLVVSKPELVKDVVGALEERKIKSKSTPAGKRGREKSGLTPEQDTKTSKIATLMGKGEAKAAGGKVPPAGQL